MPVEYLYPISDRTVTWTPSTGTTHWNLVDDPHDSPDDSDYVSKSDTTGNDYYNTGGFVIADALSVTSISIVTRIKSSATSAKVRSTISVNGTIYQGNANSSVGSFANFTTDYAQNPNTLANWTVADAQSTGSAPYQYAGVRANITTGQTVETSEVFLYCTYVNTKSVSLTDSGSGSENVSSLTNHITSSETGTGSDSIPSAKNALTSSDTGYGSDTLPSMKNSLVENDYGTGEDILSSLLNALHLFDNAIGNDSWFSINVSFSVPESGSGFDDVITSQTRWLSVLDSGIGTDSDDDMNIEAGLILNDSGTSNDDLSNITNTFTISDNILANDSIAQITNAFGLSDSAVAVDLLSRLGVFISLIESALGVDSMNISAHIYSNDTGTASETTSIRNRFSASDSATGSDSRIVRASISLADSGKGNEKAIKPTVYTSLSESVLAVDTLPRMRTSVPISESGSGSDIQAIRNYLRQNDSGNLYDALTPARVTSIISDIGSGVDALRPARVSFTGTDSASATDNLSVRSAVIMSDLGSGIDNISSPVVQLTINESGHASEGQSISVTLSVNEDAQGVDYLIRFLQLVSVKDVGSGTDMVFRRQRSTGKISVTFTIRKPSITINNGDS